MLGREVWGWRLLAVLLIMLLVPTIPQLGTLENEWRESINSPADDGEIQVGEDTDYPPNEEENIEVETDEDDKQESDASSESFEAPTDDESSDGTGPEGSTRPDWILPATQVIVLSMMSIMAVGLLTSTAVALLTSEASRFTILLALIGPLLAITQKGPGGIFTRGRILGFIEAHPGIHFSALRDAVWKGEELLEDVYNRYRSLPPATNSSVYNQPIANQKRRRTQKNISVGSALLDGANKATQYSPLSKK